MDRSGGQRKFAAHRLESFLDGFVHRRDGLDTLLVAMGYSLDAATVAADRVLTTFARTYRLLVQESLLFVRINLAASLQADVSGNGASGRHPNDVELAGFSDQARWCLDMRNRGGWGR